MEKQLLLTKLEDQENKLVLKAIVNQPYIERKELVDKLGYSVEKVDEICQTFIDSFVVLELTSQATSNIESRVPRKVYLVNPELEQTIRELV
jgi:predicted transcriptional regulator